jgi:hypothetical protein
LNTLNERTYPAKGMKSIRMSLDSGFLVNACVPPISIHDECDVLRDRSGGENGEEEVLSLGEDIIVQVVEHDA